MPAGATGQLEAAGFSPDEIAAFARDQRTKLAAAGFSESEIDDHLGGAKPWVPPAFLDRIKRGMDLDPVISAIGKGAAEGYGTPQAMSPETERFWEDLGIFNDPAKGQASPIRSFNEALIRPLSAAINFTGAAFNAGVYGIGGGVEQFARQTGVPEPEKLGRETMNLLNAVAAESMSRGGHLTRPSRTPTGEVTELPIGKLPEARDFGDAGKATVGTINPDIEAKITRLWNENGIHPAEVAHDAAGDVTISQDLASAGDTLPRHYVEPGEPATTPEVHEVARQLEPEQMKAWETHTERRSELQDEIDRLQELQRQRTSPEILDLDRQIDEKRAQRLEAARADRAGLANEVIALERRRAELVDALPPVGTDSAAMAEARQNLQENDYRMRDMAPEVSATYRLAEAEMPPPPSAEEPPVPPGAAEPAKTVGDHLSDVYAEAHANLTPEASRRLVEINEEIAAISNKERSPEQQARIAELTKEREALTISYDAARAEAERRTAPEAATAEAPAAEAPKAEAAPVKPNIELGPAYIFKMVGWPGRGGVASSVSNLEREISQGISKELPPFKGLRITQEGNREIAAWAKGEDIRGERPAEDPNRPWLVKAWEDAKDRLYKVGTVKQEATGRTPTALEHIVVAPELQRTGLGTELLKRAQEIFGTDIRAAKDYTEAGAALVNAQKPPAATGEAPPAPQTPGIVSQLLTDESGALRLSRPPPPRPPAVQKILDRLSIGESDRGRPWTWSRLYSAVVDRLHALNTTTNFLRGQSILSTSENPYSLARLYAGVSGKANQWLNHATYDFNTYANTGKSLREILEPVTDLDDFRAYASSLRALELEQQGIKTGFDLNEARTVAQAGHAQYAPIMAELVEYQNKLVAYLRDSGVISDAGYNAMTAQHQLYVPFQRMFGDVAGDLIPETVKGMGGTLQASDPIHQIKGSERRVVDPLESIIRNTYTSLMMAERNAVGTALVDLINRAGNMPVPARAGEISLYRNGVRETHRVDEALAAAIKGLDEESANSLIRALGVPARMLRAGATLSPDFMLRNPIRDFFSAVINTGKAVFSPVDTVKGLLSAIHKDAEFQEFLKGGGSNAALVSLDRNYLQQNLDQLTRETGLGSRAWNTVRHPIDSLRALSELTEQATRLGEFISERERAVSAGASAKEAAQKAALSSREVTVDFARRGSATQSINMITAFWNAQVQGVDRLARAFRDNPAGTSLKIAGGITLPSIALWVLNHDDPDFQELPGWEHDLFWHIPVGSAPPSPLHVAQGRERGVEPTPSAQFFMRIPKPFEVGVMFGSGPERLLDAFYANKPDAFKDFAKSVWGALTPAVIPTVGVPLVEQFANRSQFTDRTLIPQQQEKLLPEYQYNPYTTETAKKLGSLIAAFPGIREASIGNDIPAAGVARALTTPILMENYLRGWTGGLGTYALQIADAGLRKTGMIPDPPKPDDTLADIPFVKAFVARYPSASTESVQKFNDEYEHDKRYFDSWMAKAQEGDMAALLRIQNAGGVRLFLQFDQIKQAMAENSKLVRDIYKNPEIPSGEKRQLIDQLYFNEIQIAKAGLTAMRAADQQLKSPGPPH